jgi:hypothetical protein
MGDATLSGVSLSMAYAVVTASSPTLEANDWLDKLSQLLDASGDRPGSQILCLHDGLAFGEAGIRLAHNVGEARAIAARPMPSSPHGTPAPR